MNFFCSSRTAELSGRTSSEAPPAVLRRADRAESRLLPDGSRVECTCVWAAARIDRIDDSVGD